jgi:hypothetical protein
MIQNTGELRVALYPPEIYRAYQLDVCMLEQVPILGIVWHTGIEFSIRQPRL